MNFGRRIKLTIYRKNESTGIEIDENLEVEANITRAITSKNKISKFKVYNLSETTISSIRKGDAVEFSCGYEELHLVYSGKINTVEINIEGVDKFILINCNGDFDTLNSLVISKSYKDLISTKTVVEDLLKATSVPYSINPEIDLSKKIKYSHTGRPLDSLKRVLKVVGCTIYNDNGKLIVSKEGKQVKDKMIPLINSESGMVGSPLKSDKKITVTTLFDYRLKLGGYVKIESKLMNLTGKIVSLNFVINSRENDFDARMELEEVR